MYYIDISCSNKTFRFLKKPKIIVLKYKITIKYMYKLLQEAKLINSAFYFCVLK